MKKEAKERTLETGRSLPEAFARMLKPGAFTDAALVNGVCTVGAHNVAIACLIDAPDCLPDYETFSRAIRAFTMPRFSPTLTDNGRLTCFEKAHAILIPCRQEQVTLLDGSAVGGKPCPLALIDTLTALRPFATPDPVAEKWFFNAIHFDGPQATVYGSNVCAQYWHGEDIFDAPIALPISIVDTILAAKLPPVTLRSTTRDVSFDFGEIVARARLFAGDAPDFNALFAKSKGVTTHEITEQVRIDVAAIKKQAEDRALYVKNGLVATKLDFQNEGARVATAIHGSHSPIVVNAEAFLEVVKIAERADFASGGNVYFEGPQLRGILLAGAT